MFFFYEKPVYKKLSTRTSEKLQKNLFTLLFFESPLFCLQLLKYPNQIFHKNLSRIYYSCYMFSMPNVSLEHYYSF